MISDDDLLLYYYRDGLDVAERARIGAALSDQPELARRLHRLVAQLDAAAAMPDVPVPVHVRQRWQSALDRAAHNGNEDNAARVATTSPGRFTAFRWQAAAAASVGLILLVTILVSVRAPREQVTERVPPPATHAAASTEHASAYERGLKWHLANTEQRLASLDSAPPDERVRLIEMIIAQNRIYALAADRAGEPQLARVLRAFTPILDSLAADGRDSSESEISQLRFELRVIQTRLDAAADIPSTAPPVAL